MKKLGTKLGLTLTMVVLTTMFKGFDAQKAIYNVPGIFGDYLPYPATQDNKLKSN